MMNAQKTSRMKEEMTPHPHQLLFPPEDINFHNPTRKSYPEHRETNNLEIPPELLTTEITLTQTSDGQSDSIRGKVTGGKILIGENLVIDEKNLGKVTHIYTEKNGTFMIGVDGTNWYTFVP